MEPTETTKPRPTRWIALAALLFLAVGLGMAALQLHVPGRASSPVPSSGGIAPVDTSGDPVGKALKQAGGEDEKSRWIDDLSEVDLASLDGEKRGVFLRQVNTRRCTCGCGYTLAACRIYDASCDKSLPRVRAVYDSVARGLLTDVAGMREPPSTP